jgi:hypothetical protein
VIQWTQDTKVTLGDAMVKCSGEKARLTPVKSCDAIDILMEEIYEQYGLDNQTYFVGSFTYKNPEQMFYRNWAADKSVDS